MIRHFIVLAGLFIAGCASVPERSATMAMPVGVEPVVARSYPDVNLHSSSVRQYCLSMVGLLNAKKTEEFLQEIDEDRFFGIDALLGDIDAFANLHDNSAMRPMMTNFVAGFKSKFSEGLSIARELRMVDAEPGRCVLRSDYDEDGVVVYELTVEDVDGVLKVVDFHDYVMNSSGRAGIRRAAKDMFSGLDLNSPTALRDLYQNPFVNYAGVVKQGNAELAIAAFERLPQEMLRYSQYYQTPMQLAEGKPELQKHLLSMYLRNVPEEEQGLVALDYYFLAKDVDGMLRLIQRVEAKISQQPIFDDLRAIFYYALGNKKQFLAYVDRMLESPGQRDAGLFMLADYYVDEKLYADAVGVFDFLQAHAGYSIDVAYFESQATYKHFVASPEFVRWAEQYQAQQSKHQQKH